MKLLVPQCNLISIHVTVECDAIVRYQKIVFFLRETETEKPKILFQLKDQNLPHHGICDSWLGVWNHSCVFWVSNSDRITATVDIVKIRFTEINFQILYIWLLLHTTDRLHYQLLATLQ